MDVLMVIDTSGEKKRGLEHSDIKWTNTVASQCYFNLNKDVCIGLIINTKNKMNTFQVGLLLFERVKYSYSTKY
jgi:hypothetical protein